MYFIFRRQKSATTVALLFLLYSPTHNHWTTRLENNIQEKRKIIADPIYNAHGMNATSCPQKNRKIILCLFYVVWRSQARFALAVHTAGAAAVIATPFQKTQTSIIVHFHVTITMPLLPDLNKPHAFPLSLRTKTLTETTGDWSRLPAGDQKCRDLWPDPERGHALGIQGEMSALVVQGTQVSSFRVHNNYEISYPTFNDK